jgi:hypothetical protein
LRVLSAYLLPFLSLVLAIRITLPVRHTRVPLLHLAALIDQVAGQFAAVYSVLGNLTAPFQLRRTTANQDFSQRGGVCICHVLVSL